MIELVISNGVDKQLATKIVEDLLESIRDSLLNGESVNLLNIGTLTPKKQLKTSRISFGREIEIKKEIKVSFRLSNNFEPVLEDNVKILEMLRDLNTQTQQCL